MNYADTLICDQTTLAQFQTDEAYNYGRELKVPEQNLLEWLWEQFVDWLQRIFSGVINDSNFRPWLYVLGVVVIITILYFAYRNRHRFFHMEREKGTEVNAENDNIYGVDFVSEIQSAVAKGDWRQAVRMRYLQTLRWLADGEKITWQSFKTPTQYMRELESPHAGEFRRLTNHFIRIRYGNFPADRQLFEEVSRLSSVVCSEEDSVTSRPGDDMTSGKEVADEQ